MVACMTQPLIGITADSHKTGTYSNQPFFTLSQNYCDAITETGGAPVLLPHSIEAIDRYTDQLNGLVISGGAFDIDPTIFGAKSRHKTVTLKEARTSFELLLARSMLAHDKPVLGICGGEQLLHVILGGSLIQHIPATIPNALQHEQTNPRDEPGHFVKVRQGTLLHEIVGELEFPVNSAHHQAAKDEPEGVTVNAVAPDGVIEGIESKAHRFCLGVQWHPEFFISDADTKIFKAFISATRK